MNDDASVFALCRYFAGCQYSASGTQDFVRANYKQHLREHHAIRHPRVEPEEVRTCDDDCPAAPTPTGSVPA